MEAMDRWVGEKLRELEEAGLADNTIVFYYSDHAGILGRSKRYLYESGLRVPLIVRFPRSEEHPSELQSLMRISYAVFCLKKKKTKTTQELKIVKSSINNS